MTGRQTFENKQYMTFMDIDALKCQNVKIISKYTQSNTKVGLCILALFIFIFWIGYDCCSDLDWVVS